MKGKINGGGLVMERGSLDMDGAFGYEVQCGGGTVWPH